MKYLLPIVFSIPLVFLLLLILLSIVTGEYLLVKLPEPFKALSVVLPLVGFAACVAMMFIRPDNRVWKIATIFNVLPIAFVFLIFTFFWIIGYNG